MILNTFLSEIYLFLIGIAFSFLSLFRFGADFYTQYVVIVLLTLALAFFLRTYKPDISVFPLKTVVLLTVIFLLGTRSSPERSIARNETIIYIYAFIASLLFSQLAPGQKRIFFKLPVLIAAWYSALIISSYISTSAGGIFRSDILTAYTLNPDAISGFMLFSMPFAIIFSVTNKKVNTFLFLLIFLGVLMTRSRTCIILSFIVVIYWLRYSINTPRYMLKALIVSLATFFAIVVYFKINNYHGMGFGALYDRFVWCESALRMAREKPFFGFGPGCFGNLYLSYKVLPANNTAYLHNIAIQLLIESGLAGFIVFLWLFLKACYLKLNSSCELDKIAVVSLLCYTASELSGFTYNLLAFKIIFFITLLSSCGDSQALKREKPLYSKTIALLASFLVLIWPSLIFSATLLKNSGLYYIDNKNPHAAISMFERSIALDPLPSDVYSNMASALFSEYAGSGDKGYLSRSIAAQTEAAKRSPANAARYSDLAWLYFTDSRHEEAKEFIKKAFLLDRFNKKYADSLRLMNKNENTIQN